MTGPVTQVALVRAYGESVNAFTLRYMIMKGLVYAAIGASWIIAPSPGRAAGIEWLEFVTPAMVGGAWIVAGLLPALVALAARSSRWFRAAWASLIAAPAIIGFYFLTSWIFYVIPGSVEGSSRGLSSSIIYAGFALSAYLMARVHMVSQPLMDYREGD